VLREDTRKRDDIGAPEAMIDNRALSPADRLAPRLGRSMISVWADSHRFAAAVIAAN